VVPAQILCISPIPAIDNITTDKVRMNQRTGRMNTDYCLTQSLGWPHQKKRTDGNVKKSCKWPFRAHT
jgi:hypothetical protein